MRNENDIWKKGSTSDIRCYLGRQTNWQAIILPCTKQQYSGKAIYPKFKAILCLDIVCIGTPLESFIPQIKSNAIAEHAVLLTVVHPVEKLLSRRALLDNGDMNNRRTILFTISGTSAFTTDIDQ